MSSSLNTQIFDFDSLIFLPSINLTVIPPLDVLNRLLRNGFDKNLLKGNEDKIREYFISCLTEDPILSEIFGSCTQSAKNLIKQKSDLESDREKICLKLKFHLEDLQLTSKEMNELQPRILAIYRQVVEQPLVTIEAQIDQQIATLANNIMLRRLTEQFQGRVAETLKS